MEEDRQTWRFGGDVVFSVFGKFEMDFSSGCLEMLWVLCRLWDLCSLI